MAEALRGERGPPPHFAGRKAELGRLHARLDGLLRTRDASEGMALVTGVPGAGKTQLAHEFVREVGERTEDVATLFVETDFLPAAPGLFLAMGRALSREDDFRKMAELDSRVVGAGGGALSLKGNVAWEHQRHTGAFPALLRQTHESDVWEQRALVIVIDEIQTLSPDGMPVLRVLHQGIHGCPILVVALGLQHSEDALASPGGDQAGISRIEEPIVLGCLSPSEAEEAVTVGLQKLGHKDVPLAAARTLAEHTFGFPQHVNAYLSGAETAIAKYGALSPGQPLDEAVAIGDAKRRSFYNRRLSQLSDGLHAMLPVIQAMRSPGVDELPRRAAEEAIDKAGYDGKTAVEEAIMHGVLTKSVTGVGFGIPSFHDHMSAFLDQHGC